MRLLVCGSRTIDDYDIVESELDGVRWTPDTIVHGDARGVDQCASKYAIKRGIDLETHPIPEWIWSKVGATAGPMRNEYMVEQCDAVVAVWDGESSGTLNTIKAAEGEGIPVRKVVCDEQDDGSWTIRRAEYLDGDQARLGDF